MRRRGDTRAGKEKGKSPERKPLRGFQGFCLFLIFGVAEFPARYGNGDLHQEGEDKKTRRPDPERDHELRDVGDIFIDLPERVGNESGDHKTRAFLDPDPGDNEETAQIEGAQMVSRGRKQKDKEGQKV